MGGGTQSASPWSSSLWARRASRRVARACATRRLQAVSSRRRARWGVAEDRGEHLRAGGRRSRQGEDAVEQAGQFGDGRDPVVRRRGGLRRADPHRAAARGPAGLHVALAVSDHPARGQIDVVLAGRAQQHAGLGFAASALAVVVRAVVNVQQADAVPLAKQGGHQGVNALHVFGRHAPQRNPALVGDHDQRESPPGRELQRGHDGRVEGKILPPVHIPRSGG